MVRSVPVQQTQSAVTKEVPKFSYDIRTIMVPTTIMEEFQQMEAPNSQKSSVTNFHFFFNR